MGLGEASGGTSWRGRAFAREKGTLVEASMQVGWAEQAFVQRSLDFAGERKTGEASCMRLMVRAILLLHHLFGIYKYEQLSSSKCFILLFFS